MIKIIRRIWLPTTLPELAIWFSNFAKQFDDLFAALGFSAAENTSVQNDNLTVQWLATAMEINEASYSAMKTFRDQTLFGEKNDDAPGVPPTDLPAAPAARTASIIQRLTNLVDRIELADNFTPDIAALLGIVAVKTGDIAEGDVKPSVEAFEGAENFEFAVVVTNRAKADQCDLQMRLPGQESWQSLKMFTGKSCNARYQPADGQSIKIEIRVQLYRSNEKYGQPSNPVYVRLNP